MATTGMTYWMHTSAQWMVDWPSDNPEEKLPWTLVRCLPHGHADLERIVRAMGMVQVDREILEEIYSPVIVTAMEESSLVAVEKMEKAGLISLAIEAMDEAGV